MAPPLTLTLEASQPQLAGDAQCLRGEGFVGLDQVEVLQAPAGLPQRQPASSDRAHAHDLRGRSPDRP
jgi:hypothetical protein